MPTLTINDITVQAPEGSTLLEAARTAGIHIPTLCHLPGVHAPGACRVCLVEVEGARTLMASCVTPAHDGMRVRTNSPRARNGRREVVELLLSEHEGDCTTCARSEDCELRAIAREAGVKEVHYQGERRPTRHDHSTKGLVRDTGKCILCRRCVAVCQNVESIGAIAPQERGFGTYVGPAFHAPLSEVTCVQCGQCSAVCPVGAIGERDQVDEVWRALNDPKLHVVVQTAPAIRAALGECFGLPPGSRVTGKMTSALRRLGFDAVFDTNFSADLTIMEEGHELLSRLRGVLGGDAKHGPLPMFTSCCPAWIQFAEHFAPDMLHNLSTCKSPQQMLGALAKSYYAEKIGKKPEEVFVVSIMPCTAKKYECDRDEMRDSGAKDVDVVLTTRELGRMIREAGIDFASLADETMDAPLGISTGAADIFANSGGVMEAALRTAYEVVTGRPLPPVQLEPAGPMAAGGVLQASIQVQDVVPAWSFLEGQTLTVAVVHGLAHARQLMEDVRTGRRAPHFVEVMTCPGGCIGGGGQPRPTTDEVRQARIRAICEEDASKPLRKSHTNPGVTQLYEEFLGEPLGERSHHLLHTHYHPRCFVPKAPHAPKAAPKPCAEARPES